MGSVAFNQHFQQCHPLYPDCLGRNPNFQWIKFYPDASAPLWAVLIAHFYNHEKITTGKLIGMLLGFGGVIVMIGVNSLSGIGMNTLGQLAMLLATLCYAFAGAYSQRVKQHSPAVLATGQVMVSTVIMFGLMMLIDRPWLQPAASLASWGSGDRIRCRRNGNCVSALFPCLAKLRGQQCAPGYFYDSRHRSNLRNCIFE